MWRWALDSKLKKSKDLRISLPQIFGTRFLGAKRHERPADISGSFPLVSGQQKHFLLRQVVDVSVLQAQGPLPRLAALRSKEFRSDLVLDHCGARVHIGGEDMAGRLVASSLPTSGQRHYSEWQRQQRKSESKSGMKICQYSSIIRLLLFMFKRNKKLKSSFK